MVSTVNVGLNKEAFEVATKPQTYWSPSILIPYIKTLTPKP